MTIRTLLAAVAALVFMPPTASAQPPASSNPDLPQSPALRPEMPGAAPTVPAPDPCPELSCKFCGPEGRVWVTGEYLMWWARGSRVPALASDSPAGTPVNQAGVLGTPGARTLYGGDRIEEQARHGFRVRAGGWLDCERRCGLEAGFFRLGNSSDPFSVGSATGNAVVGRPFIDATTGLPAAELVSFPGVLAGFVTVDPSSDFLGADAAIRKRLCCLTDECSDPCVSKYLRVDLLAGYRFFQFRDRLTITENLTPLTPDVIPGTTIVVRDDFRSSNWFHGGFLGVAAERSWGRCFAGAQARVNLGAVTREVTISGTTTVTVPGGGSTVNTGGLLAQVSNIGTHRSSEFAAVPEFDLRFGCQITSHLRAFAGYTLIIWPNVSRAGEQIDPVVNPGLIPPPAANLTGPFRPLFPGQTSTLVVQGVSAGLEYRW